MSPSNKRPPPPHVPENLVLSRTDSQWIFTPSELLRAPSILDGLNPVTEQSQRAKGVNFITQVGVLLKLPQLTTYVASVYLNRFFMRYSMETVHNRPGMHYYAVAATATFLATKVEENCRKMKELVVACARVAQKDPSLLIDENSKEFWRWRDTILHNEDVLLEGLCFDLQITPPHKPLFEFLCYFGAQDHKKMRNASWAFVNDSALTTLCLQFTTRTIAAAGLYIAARHTNFAFPDDEYGRSWWEQLDVDVLEVQKACHRMTDIYENHPLPIPLPRTSEKGLFSTTDKDGEAEAARTRLAVTPIHNRNSYSPSASLGGDSQGVKRDREEAENSEVRGEQDTHKHRNSHNSQSENGATSRPASTIDDPSTNPPSPKRQRMDLSQREPPGQNGHRQDSVDDVQSRIDAIIGSAGDNQPILNQAPQYHPTLSRRPSQQNHHHQQPPPPPPPPPVRRSSSSRSRNSQSHYPQSNRLGSYERGQDRGGSYDRERRSSYDRDRRNSYDQARNGDGRVRVGSYDRDGDNRDNGYEGHRSYDRRQPITEGSSRRSSRDEGPPPMDRWDRDVDGGNDAKGDLKSAEPEGSGSEEGEL